MINFKNDLLEEFIAFTTTVNDNKTLQKRSILQDIAIEILKLANIIKENKISPDA